LFNKELALREGRFLALAGHFEVSTDNGETYTEIATVEAAHEDWGSLAWRVPNIDAPECIIRIYSPTGEYNGLVESGVFEIVGGKLGTRVRGSGLGVQAFRVSADGGAMVLHLPHGWAPATDGAIAVKLHSTDGAYIVNFRMGGIHRQARLLLR
jgi:hypothetical protein